jgi:hypothetical protein
MAGTEESIVMVEGNAHEVSEAELLDAMRFGHEAIKRLERLGGKCVSVDFRLLDEAQRIKNELVHEESDMVEIYPSRSREIDMPQTHLWCLPPGYRIPLGLMPMPSEEGDRDVIPGVIKRSELQFYVLETPQPGGASIVEVFADEADAVGSYQQGGVPLPEGGALRMLGMVPTEEEGAAWSPAAQARREVLSERISEAGRQMAEKQEAMESQVRFPNGNHGIEDEIEASGAFGTAAMINGSLEPEESDRLGDLMRDGIARHAAEREAEISAEEAAAQAADDLRAQGDLAEMRRQLVKTGRVDGNPTRPEDVN